MVSQASEPVEVIRSSVLDALPHGFLGRRGGVSTGIVAGLQVGLNAGDDDATVTENRRMALEAACPGANLVTLKQVHSAKAVTVEAPWSEDERPEADGMATSVPGLALAIVTADCAPVLLADRDAGVVGAAHAGWRGAYTGILESTIRRMEGLGAQRERILAAIGPCIAQDSYEVGYDLREKFDRESDARFFYVGRPGKWQFDLEAYAASRLQSCGIAQVEKLGLDTYPADERFFSHRRSVHRNEPSYGRQFSMIALAQGS